MPGLRVGEITRLTGIRTHGSVTQLYQSVGVKAGGGWPVDG